MKIRLFLARDSITFFKKNYWLLIIILKKCSPLHILYKNSLERNNFVNSISSINNKEAAFSFLQTLCRFISHHHIQGPLVHINVLKALKMLTLYQIYLATKMRSHARTRPEKDTIVYGLTFFLYLHSSFERQIYLLQIHIRLFTYLSYPTCSELLKHFLKFYWWKS